jgi:uncharacterized protein YdaT
MPWTAEEFRSKHAKDLSPEQAAEAAKQANAILKSGAPEGVAIATAIKNAKRKPKYTKLYRKER